MCRSSEEASVLATIGYICYQSVYQLDTSEYSQGNALTDRIPKYVAIRNEERRKYHKQNEIVMKKKLQECLQSVFKNHEEVSVVVLDKYGLSDQVNSLGLCAVLIVEMRNLRENVCSR